MRPCHLIIAFYASRFLITLPTSGTAFQLPPNTKNVFKCGSTVQFSTGLGLGEQGRGGPDFKQE